jgi:hypothetical protein
VRRVGNEAEAEADIGDNRRINSGADEDKGDDDNMRFTVDMAITTTPLPSSVRGT